MPGPRGATALYNRMDRTRVEHVVVEHVIGGQIVREFIERPGILHSQPVGSTQKERTMTRQLRSSLSSVLALGLSVGARAKHDRQADPQTQTDLEACKRTPSEKDKLSKAVQDENASLMRGRAPERRDHGRDRRQRADRQARKHRRRPAAGRRQGRRGRVEGIPRRRREVARRDPEVLRAGAQEEHRPAGAHDHADRVGELRAAPALTKIPRSRRRSAIRSTSASRRSRVSGPAAELAGDERSKPRCL